MVKLIVLEMIYKSVKLLKFRIETEMTKPLSIKCSLMLRAWEGAADQNFGVIRAETN